MLFLCCLPSTVQSSIAFTSIGRGNVAAAVCAASASNLLGIFLTPVLVGLLMHAHGDVGGWDSIKSIVIQLLVPFVAGQLVRPWVKGWIEKHKALVGQVDRGSILLVVYSAFSAAVVGGIWKVVSIPELGVLLVACVILLAVVMAATLFGARALGFLQARRGGHRVLRLQEEPGHRRADGRHPVPGRDGGRAGPAADAVPPDPADGLFGDRPALRRAPADEA
jgi:sodium/bile acid cotransporter 7